MKILIFEGIATNGKSTIISNLSKGLSASQNIVVASESETHLPIMDQRSELHKAFYLELINNYLNIRPDVVIFDRLYITQAFRAGVGIEKYAQIETLLLSHSPLTIFLKVDEDKIAERVRKATEHRDSKWSQYINTRGKSIQEIAQYYTEQQQSQLQLLEQSSIPRVVFNTTNHDYSRVEKEIIALL